MVIYMKKIVLVMALMCLAGQMFGAQNQKYLDYIAKWKDVAIQHQKEYGIPASITLAQGLLESSAGNSELATEANNHFGIKCTSEWLGDVYRHDDDAKGECFRKYRDAEESYRDHAKFLQRSRYERLFTLSVTDYQSWAQGLKDCGYATDPTYPQKLIRIIEDYNLANLTEEEQPQGAEQPQGEGQPQGGSSKNDVVVIAAQPPIATFAEEAEEEYVRPLSAQEEREAFFAHHGRGKCNGVRYTVAREGDTYASVAFSLNVPERTLRENNDALGRTLKPGDRIYLGLKKRQAPKDKPSVWVKPGESVWSVIQREGITDEAFREWNGLPEDVRVFKTRQQVLLRKQK